MKKIGLIIASQDYQPIEYGVPKEMLISDGYKVITISDKGGVAIAKDGSTTDVDMTLDQIDPIDFEGLFLIGGKGAMTYLDQPKVYEPFKQIQSLGRSYGAICISPRILAHAGVLRGKKATGWNDDNQLPSILTNHGASFVNKPVVIDDNVITASGPSVAQEFALGIIEVITKA